MKLLYLNCLSIIKNILLAAKITSFQNFIVKSLLAIVAFTLPTTKFILLIYLFVIFDTVTGIRKAKLNNNFQSKLLRKSIIDKFILYNLLFVSFLALDVFLIELFKFNLHYSSVISSLLIAYYELVSIVENLNVLYPNNDLINNISKLLIHGKKKINQKLEHKIDEL